MSVHPTAVPPAAEAKSIPRQARHQYDQDLEQTPEPEPVSCDETVETLPHLPQPPPARTIYFALEESLNLLSAIKCTFDHLAVFPMDRFVLVAVVDSENDKEVTMSRASTLLRSLDHHAKSHFTVQVHVAPFTTAASLICKEVNMARPDLLILGLSGNSFLGSMSSFCIVNAKCRVIIKRLTYALEVDLEEQSRREGTVYRESL
ncbi:UNVERIFIED_CONTAM: hypothetical protein HDU68_000514 [Siphonaria sp. JEL0065]|nr:hypothetical protein HDU68_000514 [Siphonaria sp. JEL0065]